MLIGCGGSNLRKESNKLTLKQIYNAANKLIFLQKALVNLRSTIEQKNGV